MKSCHLRLLKFEWRSSFELRTDEQPKLSAAVNPDLRSLMNGVLKQVPPPPEGEESTLLWDRSHLINVTEVPEQGCN